MVAVAAVGIWVVNGIKRDTINSALELTAAVEADRRADLLASFRDLLGRLDLDVIDADEAEDHAATTSPPKRGYGQADQ